MVDYQSRWLMDDGVVLEPLVGNRVFHSLAHLDHTMVQVWGPEGVNVAKMAEEGEPVSAQLLCVSRLGESIRPTGGRYDPWRSRVGAGAPA